MTQRPTGASDLAVVIPHYGDPSPTDALLGILEAQRGIPGFEVVVVDDCSPAPYQLPSQLNNPVNLVRRENNGGFGSAVNTAVAQTTADMILILNSDTSFGPDFLRDLLKAARPWMPAVVSPRVKDRDGRDDWVGRKFPTLTHQTVEWLTPLARWRDRIHGLVGHDVAAYGKTAVVDWVIGVAMLLPRRTFLDVGGFDERFFMNCEETDLQRRLSANCVPSVVLADPSLTHLGGGSSPSAQRRMWLSQSRAIYAAKWSKYAGLGRLRAALTGATMVNLLANVARRAAGRRIDPLDIARTELRLIWSKRN